MKKLLVVLLGILVLTGCSKKNKNEVQEFVLNYNNIEYKLGEVFSKDKYGEPKSYSEVESCAFDGIDKTYKYDHLEVTTYPKDKKDKIYVILFLDEKIRTNEGLRISDSLEDMKRLYGNDYKQEGNSYTYTRGKTDLQIIIENNYVTSIEYNLDVE